MAKVEIVNGDNFTAWKEKINTLGSNVGDFDDVDAELLEGLPEETLVEIVNAIKTRISRKLLIKSIAMS